MRKRLGCLHAHYSNIEYIENALSPFNIELIHFVDPALMYRVTSDENFQESDAQIKVKEQIEWIAQCNVDAILIITYNFSLHSTEFPTMKKGNTNCLWYCQSILNNV
ncbi:hypothetical protein J2S09_001651 [Bacillus fengqiuensis]|nr:hypothetical protein [Bacillus fengqiuensis]